MTLGDAEKIPFKDHEFDAATVAFGVRNFEDLKTGLKEIYRILVKKGILIVLEFSKPDLFPFKQFYWGYFNFLLPLIGKIISKDKLAYTYLPNSVQHFPEKNDFIKQMQIAGFSNTAYKQLTFGITTIYVGYKI